MYFSLLLFLQFHMHSPSQVGRNRRSTIRGLTPLSADARADMVIKELTLEEKISLLHGQGFSFNATGPTESNGGAGYSVAIPRVGIPAIQMADSAYGVTRGAASDATPLRSPTTSPPLPRGTRNPPLNMAP